jgi:alkanesulfonate monooxygenase SsuD/methylene tetrahydromethanopterin reductase-like flavin-dependent oxidoreductase (luciferase family)
MAATHRDHAQPLRRVVYSIARMRFGAHLPVIDFDGSGWHPSSLASVTDAARELGYDAITANDHLVFQRPWLDGIVALSSVVERSGNMRLHTSVSLPVVRGPAAVAKAAAALDILSGGRFTLGVGPGSTARDYGIVGIDFEERWGRLEEAVRVLRAHLIDGAPPFAGRYYSSDVELHPRPVSVPGPPIWVGSWGSPAGMRRVARLADGWLGSAYNLSPDSVVTARATLAAALTRAGRPADGFPCGLATMWTYVTEDRAVADGRRMALASMLNRPVEGLTGQVLIGAPQECAAVVRAYAEAGISQIFVWPLADAEDQLERVMRDVAPLAAAG